VTQAALRARELDPSVEVTVALADAYPNYSICGIPYYVSGDVADWHNLAHRTIAELEATGMTLRLDTVARQIDPERHRITLGAGDDACGFLEYDAIVVATGALPITPPIAGLEHLGPSDGVHLLHTMRDTFALIRILEEQDVRRAVIAGALVAHHSSGSCESGGGASGSSGPRATAASEASSFSRAE
jgi:NADPH-dependent 2,4-dienoyl-CoA reductase/sulfur reductase-like enzyme